MRKEIQMCFKVFFRWCIDGELDNFTGDIEYRGKSYAVKCEIMEKL